MRHMYRSIITLAGLLLSAGQLFAADAPIAGTPGVTNAVEKDPRVHADGKGWRLDRAVITDPARPRVLFIGDSILGGYQTGVTAALKGRAHVDAWVNPYCQSENVNRLLGEVLAAGPYDVVFFNMGLHGWQKGRIPEGRFEELTAAYVEVIRRTCPRARIFWASSTPVTVKGKPGELDPDINPIILEHNRMAATVMAEQHVPVVDFYGLLAGRLDLARGDQFHWTGPAYQILADAAVAAILRELPESRPARASEPTDATEAAARKAAADRVRDERYAKLVAGLPPEEQAWERTLQENLGGFYLPIHQSDRLAGKSTAWDYVRDEPGLPRVLLIGDSVSRGYTQAVRKALAGRANVHRAPENCGPAANGLKKIEVWLGGGKWDVIHFNFGIHDKSTPVGDYTNRLEQLVARMEKTGAKIIWASTTPIPDDPAKKQSSASIVERNEAAAGVMRRHGVVVDDLFAFITPHLARAQNPNDVHFNAEGYDLLGGRVAEEILKVLPAPAPPR